VAADVAGFSRLVGADEEGTLRVLRAHRNELIDPLIAEHGGRIVNTAGDSLLLEFSSVVDAVRCSVAFQDGIAERNRNIASDRCIVFRIGINVGDVVAEGKDLLGDAVNVAARLESLSEPGGLTLSDDAYRQVRDRLELAWLDGGDHEVKNIALPVHVWHWSVDDRVATSPAGTSGFRYPIDKPSVAVLPFENMSNDPDQNYFSDGITEDIMMGLSKNPDLHVISRNTTYSLKGTSVSISDLSAKLGAQFVLQGSVRKAGQRVRITAQLNDAAKDQQLWAERYDRDIDDIFAVQDEVVGAIVHAMGATDGALERSARRRSAGKSETNQSAYDFYLQARAHFYRHADTGFDEAERLFKRAIELDPDFARAYSALAWLYFLRFKHLRLVPFESVEQQALELAMQSVRLDPDDYRAHWVLASIYIVQGKHAESVAAYDRALQLNPNDANLLVYSAGTLIHCGRVEQALERCQQAIRLNPNCPDWYLWELGACYFQLGRYEDALEVLRRIEAPEQVRRLLAATYAHLGRLEEARHEAQEFLKLVPGFSISEWAKTEPYTDQKELERYAVGLIKAGLPE
jgi:adenylate cyclase